MNHQTPKKEKNNAEHSQLLYWLFFIPLFTSAICIVPLMHINLTNTQAELVRTLRTLQNNVKVKSTQISNLIIKLENFKGEAITTQAEALGLHKPAQNQIVMVYSDELRFAGFPRMQRPVANLPAVTGMQVASSTSGKIQQTN